jgi:SAM-dependent methyltransferase
MAGSELSVHDRAELTAGVSSNAIYGIVERSLREVGQRGGLLVDVGCGTGNLWRILRSTFDRYLGIDAVRYESFPADAEFVQAELDGNPLPLPNDWADVAVSVETIEHLENPRWHMRELARVTKPGGWVVVTTPNQLSFLSLLTLVLRKRFSAFQDRDYPKHLTALLEVDLLRISSECGLVEPRIGYSLEGRIVFTARYYPRFLTRLFPRAMSDNVMLIARKGRP